ncbi:MAG: hypothetical protein RLZZ621_671, partial [Gemmatimonadota bacterium]
MRHTPPFATEPVQSVLDPQRILRWVWMGRIALASAILIAAVFVWNEAAPSDTLIATLSFALAVMVTAMSVAFRDLERQPPSTTYYALQCAVDLFLVTAIVHVTGGWSSQFAALYVLVIASGALLLPFRSGLIVAGSAWAMYAIDVLWLRPGSSPIGVLVQLLVFAVVAGASGYVALRLRQAGLGREELAAQLAKVQLEAEDILRTIRSGIMTVDTDGRLMYANPAASELLGFALRPYLGRPVISAVRRVAPELAAILERSARERVRTTRAEGGIRRGEELVEIGVTTTLAEGGGADTDLTATAIFQDISDSKRLQSLHVRAERLQAVAELSASLAHEIRNPLASIRSATEQLARRRERADSDADDDERILHGLVMREADRLTRLLTDFLDFARARVTRLDVLALGDVTRRATQLAAAHPDCGDGVVVTLTVDPDLPTVDGDEDLLHRAVFNLVLNAVQAVKPEGHVTVTVGWHRPPRDQAAATNITGALLAVTVTDDGPGIPRDLRPRVFEPFVSGKAGGSGLGLPVVHRAVEAHRGIVLIDDLERGTRFTIVVPASRTAV